MRLRQVPVFLSVWKLCLSLVLAYFYCRPVESDGPIKPTDYYPHIQGRITGTGRQIWIQCVTCILFTSIDHDPPALPVRNTVFRP
jgi:hypothetical protein